MSRSNWPTTSRQSRGYGREWEKLRAIVLERDCYLCQCRYCRADGRVTVATEVDHIVPKSKGGTDDPENLQAIAHDCHVRKTTEEAGATPKPRVRIGLDGFPIA
jgi:5-methylcytosine-specific restriction enzyme A